MGAPTINISDSVTPFTGVGSTVKTAFSLTAGRCYVALLQQHVGGTRTWTLADTGGNTWTRQQMTQAASAHDAVLWTCIPTSSATVDITVTITGGTASGNWHISEVTPGAGDTLTVEDSDQFVETTSVTAHTMAPATGFSFSADSIVLGTGGWNGSSLGTCTPGTDYTLIATNNQHYLMQYRIFTASQTDHRPPWTSVSARASRQACAAIRSAGGGGGGGSGPVLGLSGRLIGGTILGGRVF